MKKIVSGIMLALLLVSMLTLTFSIQLAKADWTWTETIYIRADGSIDPPEAPISTVDNVTYTFTDNIVGAVPIYTSAVVVERYNITVNGAGYTLQGSGMLHSCGIGLNGNMNNTHNVIIKNIEINAFYSGIILYESNNNSIFGNDIKNNTDGIYLWHATGNSIYGNNLMNNGNSTYLTLNSSDNSIFENNITNNHLGIFFGSGSSNNTVYHNNFVNNTYKHVGPLGISMNVWDDGYPSGGNYWSDYEERYPNATEIENSGIWDTPYVINDYNQDNYPLMDPWEPTMHVESIDFSTAWRGNTQILYITVKIWDQNDEPVKAATVNGTLAYPFNNTETYSDKTVPDGTVTLQYSTNKSALPTGTYTFTVTNVKKTDWTYAPALNKETSDSYTI